MSNFDYCYAYEDRAVIHTSRWILNGVSTRAGINLGDGRLWLTAVDTNDTVAVSLYKDLASTSLVATGSADISGIATAAAKCTLTASNDSGLTGHFYFESYTSDPTAVEVLVSLAMDSDLANEFGNLDSLPVWNATVGMASVLAPATRKCLLLASQMYSEGLGGFGAPEHRHRPAATREVPDYRALVNPDQLTSAVVHWALQMAMARSHERGAGTMYQELRDYHDEQRKEAISSWNLTLNSDPSDYADADNKHHIAAVSATRL